MEHKGTVVSSLSSDFIVQRETSLIRCSSDWTVVTIVSLRLVSAHLRSHWRFRAISLCHWSLPTMPWLADLFACCHSSYTPVPSTTLVSPLLLSTLLYTLLLLPYNGGVGGTGERVGAWWYDMKRSKYDVRCGHVVMWSWFVVVDVDVDGGFLPINSGVETFEKVDT